MNETIWVIALVVVAAIVFGSLIYEGIKPPVPQELDARGKKHEGSDDYLS